jgi:hypothetical protein
MQCTCFRSIPEGLVEPTYFLCNILYWCITPLCSVHNGLFSQWDMKNFSEIVMDPYSAPDISKSTSRCLSADAHWMNSIDNGLLLCLQHHHDFNEHLFSIHPDVEIYMLFPIHVLKSPICQTHIITSFHFVRSLNGLMVTQPWTSVMKPKHYPPPHKNILHEHFRASIARWMMAASEEYEDEVLDNSEGDNAVLS